jgi:hypothetical protein
VSWDVVGSTISEIDQWLDVDPAAASGRCPTTVAYRGCSDASWNLCPSVSRLRGDLRASERAILQDFQTYGKRYGEILSTEWEWWCLGQHHGLPTRLLDWSHSSTTALHFATEDVTAYDKDGVVWACNYSVAHSLLPGNFSAALGKEQSGVFRLDTLTSLCAGLEEYDAQAPPGHDYIIFIEPPSFDDRIQNQAALFSVMTSPTGDGRTFLGVKPPWMRRIVIPASLKPELRDRLDRNRVTEQQLFPDAGGLSRFLRRRYTDYTPAGAPVPPPAAPATGPKVSALARELAGELARGVRGRFRR